MKSAFKLRQFGCWAVVLVLALRWLHGADLTDCSSAVSRADYKTALSCAEAYIRVHGESAPALVVVGQSQMGLNEANSAFRALTKALRLDGTNLEALYFISKLSSVLAQSELQDLYQIDPGSPRVHQLAAESYHAAGAINEAEREYKAALGGLPRSPSILVALGELTREQTRYEDAITYYSRALELDPRNYDALYGRGASHLRADKDDLAIADFRQALTVQSNSAVAHFALGDALLRSGKDEEAASELSRAVALEVDMKEAYALLGRAYTRLGKSRDAAKAFSRFQSLSKAELDAQRIPQEKIP